MYQTSFTKSGEKEEYRENIVSRTGTVYGGA